MDYDPSAAAQQNGHIFSLPHELESARVVLLPVPWDVTTSYRPGTAEGPAAILQASGQLDLTDLVYGQKIWEYGVYMLPVSETWAAANRECRPLAEACIHWTENGMDPALQHEINDKLNTINHAGDSLRRWVYDESVKILDAGKLPGLIGGEHSCPLGLMEALGERCGPFGVLQIDAHADLREQYEQFKHSHASIFYNALKIPSLQKLVQVGLRDIAPVEMALADTDQRVIGFPDWHLKQSLHEGIGWAEICRQIVGQLPDQVYISFDIDGLDPALCPNTGTPVPGGLSFDQAVYLLYQVVKSGRKIIGFDLSEVAPGGEGDWDGNVGARVLFQLCNALVAAQPAS